MPSSPLAPIRRYLWLQGAPAALPAGTMLGDRYRILSFPLVEDLDPAAPPEPALQVPELAVPYLGLSTFVVAIPRPFTPVLHPDGRTPLLLLEEVPLQVADHPDVAPQLLPALPDAWLQASALCQVTWLWRLAKLWHPCVEHQVAASLLNLYNIRVEDEDVRLLQLEPQTQTLTLQDLGQQWRSLAETAAPPVQDYLKQLTQLLIAGKGTPAGLVDSLIGAIQQLSVAQNLTVRFATYSDTGPARTRNEDACYPPSGAVGQTTAGVTLAAESAPAPLLVVCDGVGGHQGGDVASRLAIAEVTQYLAPLTTTDHLPHQDIVAALKEAVSRANQAISDRNDADQKQNRDRMGTTIVVALVYGCRLYIAHLGDSRAYRIRTHGCRQITLDDDVAVREMRLGLELYQDALQQPGSGALVQALGMADSRYLHPTVKLFPIATESLFLLCSDGLSDHGLIDRLWASELKPVLQSDRTVTAAGQQLIELANTHNGHDNVTVGLLRLSPNAVTTLDPVATTVTERLLTAPSPSSQTAMRARRSTKSSSPTTLLPSAAGADSRSRPWLLLALVLLGGLGLAAAWGWQRWQQTQVTTPPLDADTPTGEILSPEANPPQASTPGSPLAVGDYRQIRALADPSAAATLLDIDQPPVPPPAAAVDLPKRLLATGSIVQVQSRQQTPGGQVWVRLQVCAVDVNSAVAPEPAEPPPIPAETDASLPPRDRPLPLAQANDDGWLLESAAVTFSQPLLDTAVAQKGLCTD